MISREMQPNEERMFSTGGKRKSALAVPRQSDRKAGPGETAWRGSIKPRTPARTGVHFAMQARQVIAWMKKCGIAVESARASVPSLAHVVAGEPIRGSWWAHPKGKDIFRLSRVIRRSPDVLVCRLVDGKITYVHRRMWPALILLAGRFSKQRLSALNEVHTPAGKHKLLVTPFPDWVPTEVLQAAQRLTEKEAASQLALVLSPMSLT